jgi:hypothetical protein
MSKFDYIVDETIDKWQECYKENVKKDLIYSNYLVDPKIWDSNFSKYEYFMDTMYYINYIASELDDPMPLHSNNVTTKYQYIPIYETFMIKMANQIMHIDTKANIFKFNNSISYRIQSLHVPSVLCLDGKIPSFENYINVKYITALSYIM